MGSEVEAREPTPGACMFRPYRTRGQWEEPYGVVHKGGVQLLSYHVVLRCVEMHAFPDCTGVVHTSAQADTQTDVQTNGQCADIRVIGLVVGCRFEAAAGQLRSLRVV
jgi:hypothetical protein